MNGGREMLIPTSTSAIVETGNTSTNAKSIVPNSNFFISLHPLFSLKTTQGKKNLTGMFPRWSVYGLRDIAFRLITIRSSIISVNT
jgi:hypothetical protein